MLHSNTPTRAIDARGANRPVGLLSISGKSGAGKESTSAANAFLHTEWNATPERGALPQSDLPFAA